MTLPIAGWRPTPEDTPFLRLGGREAVLRLANRFYDEMEAHEPALTATHERDERGRVTDEMRERFGLFLVMWLGGPHDYLEKRGHPRLRMRHATVPIDAAMRDAWLRSMTRALDAEGVGGEVRRFLDERFADVANFLINKA